MEKKRIDIGGCRLALWTSGEGTPSVILETGLMAGSEDWDEVQKGIAPFANVYRYDRAGRGSSDPSPQPRTAQNMAVELHTLLQRALVPPPYILVGQSFGGLIIRLFAHLYPKEVAGLVLVDPTHEDQFEQISAALPPETRGEPPALKNFRRFWSQDYRDPRKNGEGIDFVTSCKQARQAAAPLGELPLIVLTSGNDLPELKEHPAVAHKLREIWHELHSALARLSTNSEHRVVKDSGHFIQRDQPQAVIDAIREVFNKARERLATATYKVGMLLIPPRDDGAWGSAGFSGLQRIARLPGVTTTCLDKIPERDWETSLKRLIQEGCNLILAHGAELSPVMQRAAVRNSSVQFACLNGVDTAINLASFILDDEPLAYLAGATAAKMSRSGLVGFIGGQKIPPTVRQATGFAQGADEHGAPALLSYTGDFSDPQLARRTVREMAKHGVDVFYYYLNEAWRAVLEACREREIHAIASVQDRYAEMPEVVYTSAIQDVGALHLLAARLALSGQLEGRQYCIGIEDPDVARLAPFHNVPPEIENEIAELRQKIITGEIKIKRVHDD